jgi:hypothetical protein
VRRAFKQKTADQPAADIDCTGPLSPVCDCRLHSGCDDAVNLLADWRINVIHGHDEYPGFRRLPAHPIFHHRPPRAIQRFLFDVPRRTVVPRSRLPRKLPCSTHQSANSAHNRPRVTA